MHSGVRLAMEVEDFDTEYTETMRAKSPCGDCY